MRQRWINVYNNITDFNNAKPTFFECHVGGIGNFTKSPLFPRVVNDAPVDDGVYSATWSAIFNLNRPWRDYPPDDWVGQFNDIQYWMGLEINWGMRGFAITYEGGNKNTVSGYFNNLSPLNVFTEVPAIDDGNRLVNLDNFLYKNPRVRKVNYFDMSNITSLKNAFSETLTHSSINAWMFPSTKYNTSLVEDMSECFYGSFRNISVGSEELYMNQTKFPFSTTANVKNFTSTFQLCNTEIWPIDISGAEHIDSLFERCSYIVIDTLGVTKYKEINSSTVITIHDKPNLLTANKVYYMIGGAIHDFTSPYIFPSWVSCNNFFYINRDNLSIPNGNGQLVTGTNFTLPIELAVNASVPIWNWTATTRPVHFQTKSHYLTIGNSNLIKNISTKIAETCRNFVSLDTSNCETITSPLFGNVYIPVPYTTTTYNLSSCIDCSNIFNGIKLYNQSSDVEILDYTVGPSSSNVPMWITNVNSVQAANAAFANLKAQIVYNPFVSNTSVNSLCEGNERMITFYNPTNNLSVKNYFNRVFYNCKLLKNLYISGTTTPFEIHIDGSMMIGNASIVHMAACFVNCEEIENVYIYMDNVTPYSNSYLDTQEGGSRRQIRVKEMFLNCTKLKNVYGKFYSHTKERNVIGGFNSNAWDFNTSLNLEYIDFYEVSMPLDMRQCKNLTPAFFTNLANALVTIDNGGFIGVETPELNFNGIHSYQQNNTCPQSVVNAMEAKGWKVWFHNV